MGRLNGSPGFCRRACIPGFALVFGDPGFCDMVMVGFCAPGGMT